MGFIVFFSIIHEPYCIISSNFYFYFHKKSKIRSQTDPNIRPSGLQGDY